ncbi:hypothetical protein WJX81_003895 [Elliptochloris bilobata]|uniref:Dihydrolipoamide acetyltransferase component of pyruvate dehydrogenase complex n=1 Tax=Elliptochloris bilobata TaxID=381761 RepID=A0AAW1SAA9_9CHLO
MSSLPPHTALEMPALSPTMSQGNLTSWNVKEGQEVAAGDVLAQIETDKATLDWENQDDGFVAKLLVQPGAKDIPVGTPLLVLVEDEADAGKFADYSPSAAADGGGGGGETAAAAPEHAAEEGSGSGSADAKAAASGGYEHHEVNHRIGPAAAFHLRLAGVPAGAIKPTGPNGIVTKGDVLAAIEAGLKAQPQAQQKAPAEKPAHAEPRAEQKAPQQAQQAQPTPAPAPNHAVAQAPDHAAAQRRRRKPGEPARFTDLPNSQIRKIIAQRLLESKRTVPHLYVRKDARLAVVTSLRAALKEQGRKVSVNDFVIRAVALALAEVPAANARWDAKSGAAVPAGSVDVSVAVATDKGLITPIVAKADMKSLSQISAEVRELAAKARANKLKPEEFMGGSFSISNLGMFGTDRFAAIINPPQAGILAIGGTQRRVVGGQDSKVGVEELMTVTLSADHRVIDGEVAAAFLAAFAANIANPIKLLGG